MTIKTNKSKSNLINQQFATKLFKSDLITVLIYWLKIATQTVFNFLNKLKYTSKFKIILYVFQMYILFIAQDKTCLYWSKKNFRVGFL